MFLQPIGCGQERSMFELGQSLPKRPPPGSYQVQNGLDANQGVARENGILLVHHRLKPVVLTRFRRLTLIR
jgi:hypothetical protein